MGIKKRGKVRADVLLLCFLFAILLITLTYSAGVPDVSPVSINTSYGLNSTFENITAFNMSSNDAAFITFDWRTTKGQSNSLADGDMEAVGVASWTAGNSANLTKQTTSPHSGLQVLRIQYNGASYPLTSQTVATIGKTYRITGCARSDGNSAARISWVSGSIWDSSLSTSWQCFDVISIAISAQFYLQNLNSTLTSYVEFDDVKVEEVKSDNLVTYSFNSNESGNIKDYSTNAKNASINGVIFYNRTGGFGGSGAYFFNGSGSNYMFILNANNFTKNNLGSTVSVWIKRETQGIDIIWGNRKTAVTGTLAYFTADGYYFSVGDASTAISCANSAGHGDNTTWHLYNFVIKKSSNISLYVDGKLNCTTSITALGDIGSSSYTYIGADAANTTNTFNGYLDNFIITNRTLSANEISMMYNNGVGKYNTVHSDATERGETWRACLTAFNSTTEGNTTCTSAITLSDNPAISFASNSETNATKKATTSNNAFINVTTSDYYNNMSAFIDWNRSLVAWWSFDSYNGSYIIDNSSWNNFGTCPLASSACPTQVLGRRGKALSFDAVEDRVVVSPSSSINPKNGSFTILAWFNTRSLTNTTKLILERNYGVGTNDIMLNCYGRNILVYINSTNSLIGTKGNVENDVWYHFAITGTSGTWNVTSYYNSIPTESTITQSWNLTDLTSNIVIGDWNIGGGRFNGTLDDIKIFTRALSQQEIAADYNSYNNKLYKNFSSLSSGIYTYKAYVTDLAGNYNSTEQRTFIVNAVPVVSSVLLSSTTSANLTTENLTAAVTASENDSDGYTLIYDWRKNGVSDTRILMPFDINGSDWNTSKVKDYSSFNVNGTIVTSGEQNVTWNSSCGAFPGSGGCYEFNRDYTRLSMPWTPAGNPSILSNFSATEFSFCLWVKFRNVTDKTYFWGGGGASPVVYGRLSSSAVYFYSRHNDTGTSSCYGSKVLSPESWYFICYTATGQIGATRHIYVNGTEDIGTCPQINDTISLNNSLQALGVSSNNYFNGSMDHLMIWDRTLSANEISSMYANFQGGGSNNMTHSDATTKGEVWNVLITPIDTMEEGSPVTSNSQTILNAYPLMATAVITSSGNNVTTNNLTASATSTDADGDAVSYIHDWRTDKGQPTLIADGNMEAAGTASWTAVNNANLTKQTISPHSGLQVIRVQYNGIANPYMSQIITTIGKTYHFAGWARGDGTNYPILYDSGALLLWTGTSSTNWQRFDFIYTAIGTTPYIYALGSSGYSEFDDVNVTEIKSDAILNMPFDVNGSNGNTSNVKDYTSYGNNGTLVNATWNISCGAFSGSEGCYEFNDINNRIIVSKENNFDFKKDFSTSAWLRSQGNSTYDGIMGRYGVGGYLFDEYLTNGLPYMILRKIGGGSSMEVGCSGCFDGRNNGWVNIIITVETNTTNTTVKIYENGTLKRTQNGFWEMGDANTSLVIGDRQANLADIPFNGSIDQVQIWNRTLSANEISMMYNNGVGLFNRTHADATNKNEAWTVAISPFDGTNDGAALLSNSITINNTPPTTPQFIFPLNNSYTNNATPEWNISTDADGDVVTYLLQVSSSILFTSIDYVFNAISALQQFLTGVIDGNWFIRVLATDGTANSTWSSIIYFTIDTINPSIAFNTSTEVNNSYVSKTYLYMNITSSDVNLANITVRLYNSSHAQINSSLTTTSPNFLNVSSLSDGVYYFNATVRDLANNRNDTVTRKVTIDTIKPRVFLTLPNNSASMTEGYVNFTYYVNDTNSVNCTLNFYGSNFTITPVINTYQQSFYQNKNAGTYDWRIYCTDAANNMNVSETRSITLTAISVPLPPSEGGGGGGGGLPNVTTTAFLSRIESNLPKIIGYDNISFAIKSYDNLNKTISLDSVSLKFSKEDFIVQYKDFNSEGAIIGIKPTSLADGKYNVTITAFKNSRSVNITIGFEVKESIIENIKQKVEDTNVSEMAGITSRAIVKAKAWALADKIRIFYGIGAVAIAAIITGAIYFGNKHKKKLYKEAGHS